MAIFWQIGVLSRFKNSDECSYALGKQGSTRKKIEAASEAVLQYIGNTIVYAGTRRQRRSTKDTNEYY